MLALDICILVKYICIIFCCVVQLYIYIFFHFSSCSIAKIVLALSSPLNYIAILISKLFILNLFCVNLLIFSHPPKMSHK